MTGSVRLIVTPPSQERDSVSAGTLRSRLGSNEIHADSGYAARFNRVSLPLTAPKLERMPAPQNLRLDNTVPGDDFQAHTQFDVDKERISIIRSSSAVDSVAIC